MKLILLVLLVLMIKLVSLLIEIELKFEVCSETARQESSVQLRISIYKRQLFSFQQRIHFNDPRFSLLESFLLEIWDKKKGRDIEHEVETEINTEYFYREAKKMGRFFYPTVYRDLHRFLNRTLRYIVIDELEWNTRTGCEDAMMTALSTGFLWMIKGSLLGPLSSKCRLNHVRLDVVSDYHAPVFFSSLACILKIRIVHIIIIVSYAIVLKVRWWMNGFPAARKTEPSH